MVTPPVTLPPVTVARLAPRALRISSNARDRKAPYLFRVSGTLARPAGAMCSGKVKVTAKVGRKVIATRKASLKAKGATCRYAVTFRFNKRPKAVTKSGKVVLSARFLGTSALLPKNSPRKTVRIG